jgi:hypothetical protein
MNIEQYLPWLPYFGICISILAILFFQLKEQIEYFSFKRIAKRAGISESGYVISRKKEQSEEEKEYLSRINLIFLKNGLGMSFSFNVLLSCVIWAIYNNLVR